MNFFNISFLIFCLISVISCLFSTKTAYLDSFTHSQLEFINETQNYYIDSCEPVQIYLVLRHGSRYPSEEQIKKSQQFLDDLKTFRSQKLPVEKTVIDHIVNSFENFEPHGLSFLGEKEMQEIGTRYKTRFPKLFNEEIHTISSFKQRSIDSAKSFLKGIYTDMDMYAASVKNIVINNRMMRLFDECEHYVVASRENSTVFKEMTLFKKGSHFGNLIKRLKETNGLDHFEHINPSILEKLFVLCSIESSHRMAHNWCKLFADEDYPVFSYLSDLKQYWKKSYGSEINTKPSFLIIQDLFDEMNKLIKNEPDNRSVLLRFGHAENIIPLVTALGLFKDDEPLKASNFEKSHNRNFKSSLLSPFSSNVAFILNKCNTDNSFKVSLFVNELPVWHVKEAGNLECAAGAGKNFSSVCSLNDLKKQLDKYSKLNFEEHCKIKMTDKKDEL